MLHQIRKMLCKQAKQSIVRKAQEYLLCTSTAMAILVVRSNTPRSIISQTFEPVKINIPKAPSLGLLLHHPVFDFYNQRRLKHRTDLPPFDLHEFQVSKESQSGTGEVSDPLLLGTHWKVQKRLDLFQDIRDWTARTRVSERTRWFNWWVLI